MNINFDEMRKKLHTKIDSCVDHLKITKAHLEGLEKETKTTIQTKLSAAKKTVDEKKQEAVAARGKLEELVEEKKEETKEAVAEWKTNHDQKKLEKRAARAEKYAEACVVVAQCTAEQAEVAILEAVAARQDADDAE